METDNISATHWERPPIGSTARHTGRLSLLPAGRPCANRDTLLMQTTYERVPAMVRTARTDVVHALRRAGLTERTEDARLLTSELVTNAVEHSRGASVTVTVRTLPGEVFIAVGDDDSTTIPLRRRPSARDESGRGLLLLSLLADDWGVGVPARTTKSVWCLLRVGPSAPHCPTEEST
ncbi:ATP-binding protein [Wenjunlia tyrosinilytica]|uniref:Histidine kinase/HSP90-like ATPase domain-containing protein n=1 Tax=Wenjunlia tyrosinilytica TaxID=1544741 RepID=A0A917ZKP3_9ACTN|nr:ATP-binding protein [Wenjunlia tyrosinilytica]GGO84907.1 hypothetical protein GCM10012280_17460 [Wenjunlia tyrosinilytica]